MLIAAGADISVDNYEAIRLAKDLGYNEIENAAPGAAAPRQNVTISPEDYCAFAPMATSS